MLLASSSRDGLRGERAFAANEVSQPSQACFDSPRVEYDTADSSFHGFELAKQALNDTLSACQALEEAIELKVLAAGHARAFS